MSTADGTALPAATSARRPSNVGAPRASITQTTPSIASDRAGNLASARTGDGNVCVQSR
jgi:hypothetical protein